MNRFSGSSTGFFFEMELNLVSSEKEISQPCLQHVSGDEGHLCPTV